MLKPVAVEARDGFRIWVRFEDGVEGEIDLSDVAGKGVFKAWDDREFFKGVHISDHRSIAWDDVLEICPDALYMELTGLSLDEYREVSNRQRLSV